MSGFFCTRWCAECVRRVAAGCGGFRRVRFVLAGSQRRRVVWPHVPESERVDRERQGAAAGPDSSGHASSPGVARKASAPALGIPCRRRHSRFGHRGGWPASHSVAGTGLADRLRGARDPRNGVSGSASPCRTAEECPGSHAGLVARASCRWPSFRRPGHHKHLTRVTWPFYDAPNRFRPVASSPTNRLRPARYPKNAAKSPITRNMTPAAVKVPVTANSCPTSSVPDDPSP